MRTSMNTEENPSRFASIIQQDIETSEEFYLNSIKIEFPLPSQTSSCDKIVLLKLKEIIRSNPYRYLEIGSFLGGSLAPFARDPQCQHILSIDDRGRHQPDERGRTFDYTSITSQTMLDNLQKSSISISKIETFDGSISDYANNLTKYDLMFIDGEHTDWACFRDFIYGFKLLNEDSIIVFHDSRLIYKSLKIIQEYLSATNVKFKFYQVKFSDMAIIALGRYCLLSGEKIFVVEQDLDIFCSNCELQLFKDNLSNRPGIIGLFRELIIGAIKSDMKSMLVRYTPNYLMPLARKVKNFLNKPTHQQL